jgi:transcriptional regulator with XRE-family HTH domain
MVPRIIAAMANPRPTYRRTFIREWRLHRGLTQEQLAERMGISVPQLSLIENGKRPYTQATLEAAAYALNTDTASLMMRDPTREGSMWSILDNLKKVPEADLAHLADIVKTFTRKAS